MPLRPSPLQGGSSLLTGASSLPLGVASPLHSVYLALGANLATAAGGPAQTIEDALRALPLLLGRGGGLEQVSSFYATSPVGLPAGYEDQPGFVNAAARVRTRLAPTALLTALLALEQQYGRVRAQVNGPRTLDLDLLMVDDLVLSSTMLVLPHPRLAERRFVLQPLAEIAPTLLHPVLRRTIADLLAALPDAGEQAASGVHRLAVPASL